MRVTEYFMPLVTVVPVGRGLPRDGSMFVFAPVDDTDHLLFYGYYADTPVQPPQELGGAAPDLVPDPFDFAGARGDRSDRWGQDRDLIRAGHATGFGRTLLEEDVVVQTSMGPVLDRTKENLSSSDVAVAHARRILLDAVRAAATGRAPSRERARARTSSPPERAARCSSRTATRWQDAPIAQTTS